MNNLLGTCCLACGAQGPLLPQTTTCLRCGANLEVIYDNAKLRGQLTRAALAQNGERSLWRYLPLLPVDPRLEPPPLAIGWTPLVWARRLGQAIGHEALYLKDEGRNPSGSLKDRASAVVLLGALSSGATRVVGASTGNAGSSMACLAASVGLSCVIFVPATAPAAKLAQLIAFGATVLPVDGSYDQAFDLSLEVGARFGWYSRSTGFNPLTREGKKTCAFEIWEQLGYDLPDWVFVSVGDGNIISGLYKGFVQLAELGLTERVPRLAAVQSSASNAVAQAVWALAGSAPTPPAQIKIEPVRATTRADSISVDAPRDGLAAVRAIQGSGGLAIEVDDAAILRAIPLVASASGIFGEPAGVASVAGLQSALAQGLVQPQERVVCVITGSGLKDVGAVSAAVTIPPPIAPTCSAACRALNLPAS